MCASWHLYLKLQSQKKYKIIEVKQKKTWWQSLDQPATCSEISRTAIYIEEKDVGKDFVQVMQTSGPNVSQPC